MNKKATRTPKLFSFKKPTFSDLSILSGQYKGTKILSPRNSATHPMGSREKLALFNMLNGYIKDAIVADLYAGSGALGFEALSLGAKSVDFVEKHPDACRTIENNIKKLSLAMPASVRLHRESIDTFLNRPGTVQRYTLILADPPYDIFMIDEIRRISQLLSESGILALSYPAHIDVPDLPGLKLLKNRHYAAAGIAIYQK